MHFIDAKQEVNLVISVDVEGEWFKLPQEQFKINKENILSDLLNLEVILDDVQNHFGCEIPITWFLRCDDSIASNLGHAGSLLEYLDKFIERRMKIGDCFGIHPHLYSIHNQRWSSSFAGDEQVSQLDRAFLAWERYFKSPPTCSRIGEGLMNNSIAAFLSEKDIKIDSTCLPGRSRKDGGFNFDWTHSPFRAYIPSSDDYMREFIEIDKRLKFLEVPFTMLNFKTSYDKQKILRYFNLAFNPNLILKSLKFIEQAEIMTVIHPHEVRTSQSYHELISYNSGSVLKNLINLSKNYKKINFLSINSYY